MAYKKGQSGNPAGRPKGVPDRRSKYRTALQKHADDLIAVAVSQALDGDMVALRLCIDRIIPTLKATSAPINIKLSGDLAEQGQQVLEAIGSEKLAPEEGTSLMSTLQAQARLIESDELIERIGKLEQVNGI